jgi:minor histocompatibility antigen H13
MTDWDLLSSYAGLLTLAVSSIYAGSFASLPPPQSRSKDDQVKEDDTERVSVEDAWLFPVFGSVALYGLYRLIKIFGSEWINFILRWYFVLAGVGSVWTTLCSFARWAIGLERWQSFDNYSFRFSKGSHELGSISWRTPSMYLMPVALLPSFLYAVTETPKSAFLTDVLSLSFSFNALSLLKLDSFASGCVVLSGLFLYDVWWVFGTEVMVNVATNIDAPIKLLWPKSIVFSTSGGFTMLGLGDVVVPGIFVALALRYDYHRGSRLGVSPPTFSKHYFWAALFAYLFGLVTTMTVMHMFKAAQPALLYLSPACMLSFFLTALIRGELKEAWYWIDGPVEDGTKAKADSSSPSKDTKKTE